ncbi:MAG: TetR/AcrR family transcriptional regulator [Saprospiraceae bacterium]|nr:TetR/AcrR family transcriptional regulator [Lewinella sp.]
MPRIKQFNEEEVLEKAIAIFWEKGYHATSMQDLVDGMRINRASLYDTFGSKEELFDRAFRTYQKNNKKRIADFLHGHPSIKEGISGLLEKAIDSVLSDPVGKGCFVVNTSTELAPSDPAICSSLTDNKAGMEQLFAGYIQSGIDSGEISPDKSPQKIASLLFALYSGIMVLAKFESDKEKLMTTVHTGLGVLD